MGSLQYLMCLGPYGFHTRSGMIANSGPERNPWHGSSRFLLQRNAIRLP
ncbi:MAG: hypothetical protein HQL50_14595 [Magnetococcales bacterium]|nr:hypothetical protein [Magnetococcales bacterium]